MALYRADVTERTHYPVCGLFVEPNEIVDVPASDARFCAGLVPVAPDAVSSAVDEPVNDVTAEVDTTPVDDVAAVTDADSAPKSKSKKAS